MQTKILLTVLDQGRQKGLRYKKGIYANRTDVHGKPDLELVRYSSRKWEEKGNCKKTDKRTKEDGTGRDGSR
jgi:hypothetical protein